LVDLDGDGVTDVLSGSWPGELFLFRGKGKVDGVPQFEPPVKLKDKNTKTINIGGGLKREQDGSILVTGDGKFESKDGKQFIVYEDQRIEVDPKVGAGITGTASVVHAFDYDGDGDLDLLVGDIRGNVYLVPNEGTKQKWAFGKEQSLPCAGGTVKVEGDAGPFVADWDGNGSPDLLVGSGDGSVWVYYNQAPRGKPMQLAAGKQLLPPVGNQFGESAAAEPTRGMRSKVCVADWNGDGRPDLLLGDFAMLKAKPRQYTPEQQAQVDKDKAALAEVQKRYSELIQKYMDKNARQKRTAEEHEKLGKEMSEVSKQYSELSAKVPQETEEHGWVWLFLRKPAEQANAGTAK
jgi:hypothetical protein